jgi:uncharacterized membrane protein
MHGPDPRRRVRREIVAVLIGAEAGAAVGLLGFGSTPLAPLAMAAIGAGVGPLAALALRHARHVVARRWLRDQLRATDH